jgi:hypothetical protein
MPVYLKHLSIHLHLIRLLNVIFVTGVTTDRSDGTLRGTVLPRTDILFMSPLQLHMVE